MVVWMQEFQIFLMVIQMEDSYVEKKQIQMEKLKSLKVLLEAVFAMEYQRLWEKAILYGLKDLAWQDEMQMGASDTAENEEKQKVGRWPLEALRMLTLVAELLEADSHSQMDLVLDLHLMQ